LRAMHAGRAGAFRSPRPSTQGPTRAVVVTRRCFLRRNPSEPI